MTVETFIPDLPEGTLHDLKTRLRAVRWPHVVGSDDWRYGVPRSWFEELIG